MISTPSPSARTLGRFLLAAGFLFCGISTSVIAAQSRLDQRAEAPTVRATSMAELPDGTPIVGRSDGRIVALDPATGSTREVFAVHPSPVSHLAVDPRGELVAAAGTDGRVGLWKIECPARSYEDREVRYPGFSWLPEAVLHPAPPNWRRSVEAIWTPDGEHLLTWSPDWLHDPARYALQVWTRDGVLVWTGPHARGVAVHPERRCLAAVVEGQVLLGWPGEGLKTIELPDALDAVEFSPDGSRLAVGGDQTKLWILDAVDGAVKKERAFADLIPFLFDKGYVQRVAWSPSGQYLAVSVGPCINHFVLEAESLETICVKALVGGRQSEVYDVHWTPNDRLISGLGSVEVVEVDECRVIGFETGYDPAGVLPLTGTKDCLVLSHGSVHRLNAKGDSILWAREERGSGGRLRRERQGKGKARAKAFYWPASEGK